MKFTDLPICPPLLRAVQAEGYENPTPIQRKTIPLAVQGRDILASAQTGTGKTAAFALPILHRLAERPGGKPRGKSIRPRALVICPTRELATQIGQSFAAYSRYLKLSKTVLFGGVKQHSQVRSLRRGSDIIVATPGRLLDLMGQGHVDLRSIEVLVLDEADRMLDMGFIHDIRRVVEKLPAQRQTMLLSATLPSAIRQLASSLLTDPARVDITPETPTVDAIEQSVYFVEKQKKTDLLAHLLDSGSIQRVLVFTRTKHGADKVVKKLMRRNLQAEAIHGNKSQNARQRALQNFIDGRTDVLVATDIASRGIDVDGITHVINYDLTHEPETYVHRIGRTARAGASGQAVSFCDASEHGNLMAIQKLIRKQLLVRTDCPDHTEQAPDLAAGPRRSSDNRRGDGQSRQGGRRQQRSKQGQARKQRSGKTASATAPRSRRKNSKSRSASKSTWRRGRK
ncbi:MAG: DEAD/DEAH box helicase [Planctomycetota bacterium]